MVGISWSEESRGNCGNWLLEEITVIPWQMDERERRAQSPSDDGRNLEAGWRRDPVLRKDADSGELKVQELGMRQLHLWGCGQQHSVSPSWSHTEGKAF